MAGKWFHRWDKIFPGPIPDEGGSGHPAGR